ncbi:uncharacterized protein A1O9_03693 [Exophiala aquamarina CBS 119918]|uniref:Uncharacterized protein n=1 Tax=Exophiala aquamarina CBS 119918 TaxID=1182545 RepID=A0A072PTM3_9EURO|nr:uncharacterized protein A1O9_03693 [Exophiala aquamarina CBS 119918]KEF58850.1 hypothetical protein A1O9_03693 [Exophiala aquamarina CBS 119918]
MHHLVNKDDYLLARGANPRTGVITPGSHSASSSIDHYDARRGHGPFQQGRWRQKGDQWVSLDLGEPSLPPNPPGHESLGPPYQDLADSQSFACHTRQMRGPAVQSHVPYSHAARGSDTPSYENASTFQLRPLAEGIGMFPDRTESAIGNHGPPPEPRQDPMLRRKPVGSSTGNQAIDGGSRTQRDTGGSAETVVRRLHFSNDIRSSSAPGAPRVRNFTPADVGKELPSLPTEKQSSEYLHDLVEPQTDSFLGLATTNSVAQLTNSNTSGTFGHRLAEKDLPCLPMNNGQSPLTQASEQSPSRTRREFNTHMLTQSTSGQQKPQGPRGGDLEYPFVRTARSNHHPPQDRIQRELRPTGEKEMPLPIYDNPPVQVASPVAPARPETRGPRAMPKGTSPLSTRRRDPFMEPSNTTTIRMNMPPDRRPVMEFLPSSPRPDRRGPDHRMMKHERFGSLPTHPLARPYDISMNTDMSTGSMMSVPMQRVRPRAMPRPQMPMRAEGMYGVPQVGPIHLHPDVSNQDHQTERDQGRTDSQLWTETYQEEAHLVPPPLKPRLATRQPDPASHNPTFTKWDQSSPSGLGLTRKCSRCQHGLVEIEPPGTDGATRIFELQNRNGLVEGVTKLTHPIGRGLPDVPEEKGKEKEGKQSPGLDATTEERDHSICCPDCCKEQDCHGGCLGHPSPYSTPNTSPTKSIWSEVDCPSSASEIEESEDEHDKDSLTSEKCRIGRLAFVKSAFKRSPKKRQFKFGDATPIYTRSEGSGTEGLNAAMSAAGSSTQKTFNHANQRRQRSSSSPLIGGEELSHKTSVSHSQRSVSGPRLRVPTPQGLAIACSGTSKSRNVSGNSISTLELQVPGLGSLGFGALGEMVIVPFEATKMWIRNHPQVMKLAWEVLERAWQMSQVIATTAWKLWALIFVYSKTGKLKLSKAKKETAGGFVLDCARSGVYLLMFITVGVFAMRVLNVLVGALSLVGWLFKGFFWVLRQVLGFGLVR